MQKALPSSPLEKQEQEAPELFTSGAIELVGARVHNLKNISVAIPRHHLTVVTGLSGSGKSSLVFDVLLAEGQRRYIDTFSAYARSFIGASTRPDVDSIEGLSPVVAIQQKTSSKNKRSTVGTITEIYDFLRLLYARCGTPYSYLSGKPMVSFTQEQLIELICTEWQGKGIEILAPVVRDRKGSYRELFSELALKGFVRAYIDGEMKELSYGFMVDRYQRHYIAIEVDRLIVKPEMQDRITQAISLALKHGDGMIDIRGRKTGELRHYSSKIIDLENGLSYPEVSPATFSFNSPRNWCPICRGLGEVTESFLKKYKSGKNIAIDPLDDFLEGFDEEREESEEEIYVTCPECRGHRIDRIARSYRIGSWAIQDLAAKDLAELSTLLPTLEAEIPKQLQRVGHEIIREIRVRTQFLLDVGLYYLSLNRGASTLSGGESQRIRLATQIGTGLVEVLYLLDEPGIGLHPSDNARLITSLKKLCSGNNTVVVVEHDRDMMLAADYLIDLGPAAGRLGGEVVFAGPPRLTAKAHTITADYLNDIKRIEVPTTRRKGSGKQIELIGAQGHNLKGDTLTLPLGIFTCITGVSGSGKSSLINGTLVPLIAQKLYRSQVEPLPYKSLTGLKNIDKLVVVDQAPLGRTPRSNPATYTGLFTEVRQLFVSLPESKARGYKPGRFSFNVAGGRCEACKGNGYRTLEMNFLPNVTIPCEVCHGKRYSRETLEIRYKGKSIADVLDMTINQAAEFFTHIPSLYHKLHTLQRVGLGYIKLGQPSTTLSGGESQRVKLSQELSKRDTGKTLYVLDEPTTGLHFEDIRVLLKILSELVDRGNTVLIIEHDLDVIKCADYIVDMGPEGGRNGGKILCTGTPEEIATQCATSKTAQHLAPLLHLPKR